MLIQSQYLSSSKSRIGSIRLFEILWIKIVSNKYFGYLIEFIHFVCLVNIVQTFVASYSFVKFRVKCSNFVFIIIILDWLQRLNFPSIGVPIIFWNSSLNIYIDIIVKRAFTLNFNFLKLYFITFVRNSFIICYH